VLWQLVFNLNDPVVGDRLMRTALALITDPDQLAADSVGFDDPLSASADSRVFAQGQPGSGAEAASPVAYNPVQAAKLFKSLVTSRRARHAPRLRGWQPIDPDHYRPQGSGVIDALERQLQAEWASCGVGLIVHNVPMKDLLKAALPHGRYQLALAPFVMPVFPTWNAIIYTDPVIQFRRRSSESPHGQSRFEQHMAVERADACGNRARGSFIGSSDPRCHGLEDPDVAAYFERIMNELNTDARAQLLSRLDTVLTQDFRRFRCSRNLSASYGSPTS